MTLSGMVAVVTGASSGLGKRFCECLSEAGATVVLAARRKEALDEVSAALSSESLPVRCDVGDEEQCEALIEKTIDRFGKIDILVNNAGITNVESALKESTTTFQDIIGVNLVAPYVLSSLAGRHMVAAKSGSIINIASIFGVVGAGRMPQAAYAASKGGVINLTRELAGQWGRHGVRVNAIAPGFFDTDMTTGLWDNEPMMEWVRHKTPMQRGGRVSEADSALLFLADPSSTFVTGQVIAVDGGWTAV